MTRARLRTSRLVSWRARTQTTWARSCWRTNRCRCGGQFARAANCPSTIPEPLGSAQRVSVGFGLLLCRRALRRDLSSHEGRHRLVRLEIQVAATLATPRTIFARDRALDTLVGHEGAIHELTRSTAAHDALHVEHLNQPWNLDHNPCPPEAQFARCGGALARNVPGPMRRGP